MKQFFTYSFVLNPSLFYHNGGGRMDQTHKGLTEAIATGVETAGREALSSFGPGAAIDDVKVSQTTFHESGNNYQQLLTTVVVTGVFP